MENGFQRGERFGDGEKLPEAERLYNQIMHRTPDLDQEQKPLIETAEDVLPPQPEQDEPKIQVPLPEGFIPVSYVDTHLDSLDVPDLEENDKESSPGQENSQVPQEDFAPVPAEEVEYDESYQEASQPDESVDSYNEDTQPIPAEVVDYEQSSPYEPEFEEISPLEDMDSLTVPVNGLQLDQLEQEESPIEEVPPAVGPMDDPLISLVEEPDNFAEESPTLIEGESSSPDFTSPAVSVQDIHPDTPTKKIALILSGGGARGAFQVGAELYARTVKGYHWDIIAGVSVGAMNAAMLSMHRYERLLEIWNSISDDQVYTGGFNLLSIAKLLFGAKSFYGNEPLQKLMKHEFDAGKIIDDLHVGAVSLISGEYVQFTKDFLELPEAILASGSIPVVWPPVDISAEHVSMVDGGVRNNSPVGDVLALEPDEIVIINCSPQKPRALSCAPDNVLSIGLRALDIMQNEIFINDVKEFLRINALVQEAGQNGITLHHPVSGKEYKYYPCTVIEPETALGETLDFSQRSVQASLKAGVKRARQVLGRP